MDMGRADSGTLVEKRIHFNGGYDAGMFYT